MEQYNLKGNSVRGLTGATIGFFVGFAAVALYGSTAAVFKGVFQDLNPVLLALLVAAPNLSGALLRIPFGAWVDTTGGKKPFIILFILSIIGMSGLYILVSFFRDSLSSYYSLLFIFGILSGCGIATFSVGANQTSYWFPKSKQGFALGAYAGLGNLAPGIFSLVLPIIALPLLGLSGCYLAWLIFLILGTIIYCVVGQNAWYFQLIKKGLSKEEAKEIASKKYGQELFPNSKASESLAKSAKVWKTWALVIIYFSTFGGFLALTSWLPTYWDSFFKTGTITAGVLTAMYSLLTSIIRVFGGKIADKKGGEAVTAISLIIALIGAVVMTFASSLGLAIVGVILLAIGMGIANAGVFKIIPGAIPQATSGATGWVGGLGAFGGFLIPPIMASFVTANGEGYSTGFVVFIVLMIISVIILGALSKSRKKA